MDRYDVDDVANDEFNHDKYLKILLIVMKVVFVINILAAIGGSITFLFIEDMWWMIFVLIPSGAILAFANYFVGMLLYSFLADIKITRYRANNNRILLEKLIEIQSNNIHSENKVNQPVNENVNAQKSSSNMPESTRKLVEGLYENGLIGQQSYSLLIQSDIQKLNVMEMYKKGYISTEEKDKLVAKYSKKK